MTRTPTSLHLKYPRKEKLDKEVVVLMHNGISLSHEIIVIRLVAATWMDLEIIILSEVSQKEKTIAI